MVNARGLVHLYAGGGKGKTTAAAGLCVRAAGHGICVLFCQFMKAGQSGELGTLERLGVRVVRAAHNGKFTYEMSPAELEEAGAANAACLEEVRELTAGGTYGLVVLDEAVTAVSCGVLRLEALCAYITGRPEHVELVLTGHNPPEDLCALADYHTELVCKKHPYRRGVPARPGVEY